MKIISVIILERTEKNIIIEVEYETKNIFGKIKHRNRKAFYDRFFWIWLDNNKKIGMYGLASNLDAICEMSFKGRFYI